MKELLHIEDLRTYFFTEQGVVKAVDGVDLSVNTSQTIGLVGESGCGKSMTALSILGLVPSPPGKIVSGKILFEGTDLVTLGEAELSENQGKSYLHGIPGTDDFPQSRLYRRRTDCRGLLLSYRPAKARTSSAGGRYP